jgi:hypothetical protein
VKEAISFADSQLDLIKRKPNILVLGLGFGYHIQEIINLQKLFYSNSKVIVVEPNQKLVEAYKDKFPRNFEVFSYGSVEEYFEDINFTNYLTQKPSIIKHDPSFNTCKDFYISFLSYRAPKKINAYNHLLNPTAKSLIENRDMTIDESIMMVSEKQKIESKTDFLLFALKACAKSSQDKL